MREPANRKAIGAGGDIDLDGDRDLSSNAVPIPLDAAGLNRAGLELTVKAAALLASLCLSDRIVLTGMHEGGCAGPLPLEVRELQSAGIPLSIDFFRIGPTAFVATIRMDWPPFDLVDPAAKPLNA